MLARGNHLNIRAATARVAGEQTRKIMPKRMLDGDRLWRSDKLRQAQPESFRAEYANIYPLALANGSFECAPERVWYEVYAYNRPSISTENVRAILEEFERVKLLFRWHDASNKQWGYWVGCEKTLPTPAQITQSRYKAGEPVPTKGLSDFLQVATCKTVAANELHVLGLDRNGLEGAGEEDMSIKNSLTDLSRAILGVRIGPQDSNWTEIKALVRVYGEDAVTAKFEEWAKSQTQAPSYPLSGFVRVADSLLTGKFASAVSPEDLSALINQLTRISDNRVIFNNKQRAAIAVFLDQNSADDVISVFREYFGNISGDEFKMSGAAREFTEGLASLLYTQSERRKEVARTAEQIRICTENEQRLAREQAEKALKDAEEIDSLIEDTLEA